ncbi:Ldh family oxidoreductase [Saccharicrinis aurantiacus]|uniref:Ldh family oxidoreductase n=1 Tax=Saccharicrinis aurantiacus TaxID=1849719 RepID=UPI002491713C|nr:Ldh family oxidoreductase [Saccharicrinis aurantiacus]
MYTAKYLQNFIKNVFLAMGSTNDDASLAAEVLISADLRGVDSHGVARLSGYVRLWEKGRLNATPNVKIVHETPSTAVIDGDLGAGLMVAPKAMKIAMEKAKLAGTGWVAVKNSNHYGIAGYHSMMAAEEDMIGWSMTNASALVSPTFSKSKFLGTNPISVAIPADKEPPVVIDMATTPVANGKLEVLQRKGESIPEGWAQDENGNPSTDAAILKKGGAMLPLGSDRVHGSHKGYCLGSLVDILSAVLPGANYGPWVPPFVAYAPLPENPVGEGIGHFLGAMRVDAFRPADEFKSHMDNWITTFRNAVPCEGHDQVLVPGDPERAITAERLKNGIDLLPPVVEDLKSLAEKFKLSFE